MTTEQQKAAGPHSANVRPQPAAAQKKSQPFQWEYKNDLLERDADLAQFGAFGWELVAVTAQPADQAMFYFKRRKF